MNYGIMKNSVYTERSLKKFLIKSLLSWSRV